MGVAREDWHADSYWQMEISLVDPAWDNVRLLVLDYFSDLIQSIWGVEKGTGQTHMGSELSVILRDHDGESPFWIFNFNQF